MAYGGPTLRAMADIGAAFSGQGDKFRDMAKGQQELADAMREESEAAAIAAGETLDFGNKMGSATGGANALTDGVKNLKKALEEIIPYAKGFGQEHILISDALLASTAGVIDAREAFEGWIIPTKSLVDEIGRVSPGIHTYRDEVKEAAVETDNFGKILQQSANLTIIFGRSLGGLVGSLAGAASGFKSLFGAGESGKSGFSKLFSGFTNGSSYAAEHGLFDCTTCGNCEKLCPIDIPLPELVLKMRELCTKQNLAPEVYYKISKNIEVNGNPYISA